MIDIIVILSYIVKSIYKKENKLRNQKLNSI